MPRSALEDLAMRWVPGEGPVIIHALASGLVNASYRVTRAGRDFSLRVAAAQADDLGLDRRWECEVLAAAAAAGLAPGVEVCDPAQGVLVADWRSGRAWTAAETHEPAQLHAMAQVLRLIHALPIPEPARVMDPAAWIEHYSGALARYGRGWTPRAAGLQAATEERLALFGVLQSPGRVLCHSDLHRLNLLIGDRGAVRGLPPDLGVPRVPVLLDWEYAHVSDAFWDVAGWAANNDLSATETQRLLTSYLQRPPNPTEVTRLTVLQWLYDLVCLLWLDLYSSARPGPDGGALAARADQLAARLTRAPGARAR